MKKDAVLSIKLRFIHYFLSQTFQNVIIRCSFLRGIEWGHFETSGTAKIMIKT